MSLFLLKLALLSVKVNCTSLFLLRLVSVSVKVNCPSLFLLRLALFFFKVFEGNVCLYNLVVLGKVY